MLSHIVVLPFWFSAVLFVVTCTEATCIVCCVKLASVLICGSLSVCLYKTINYYIIGIWCNIVEIYVSWWNLEVIRFSWDLTLTFGHENLLSSATNIDSPCSKCCDIESVRQRDNLQVCADVRLGVISVVLVSASREKLTVFGDLYIWCARLAIECWWVEVVFDCSSGWLYFLKAHATTRSFRLLLTRVTAMHRYKVTNYTCHTCHWLFTLTFTHWPRSTSCQLCDSLLTLTFTHWPRSTSCQLCDSLLTLTFTHWPRSTSCQLWHSLFTLTFTHWPRSTSCQLWHSL